ncbi:VOC family protein [Pseudomonas umsongensis]|uniref:VOC family protein n=1 Tax=Pseudomonas umsongensis TaxID=198618 RepID=UPI00200A31E7|nr:VOC family protein [Pseudomonas umsongensis]MCK8681846.1 hypothetical protein [Pseudomonas umsongensis]
MKILHILARQHLQLGSFDAAVSFYEDLLQQKARLRLEPVEGTLKIAQVASMLLIGAAEEILDTVSQIKVAYLVEDIAAWAFELPKKGAAIVQPLTPIPTGIYMIVRHPDGLLVEYVEHANKNPLDHIDN